LNINGVNDVRQTEIQTAEPLVPEPSAFEVEMAVEMLKSHKSPHKLTNSIWNKEELELPEVWKESITVPVHKKCDKTECNNYTGILLLSTTYKILSDILLSRLTQFAEEIIGDHHGFR
jgi:hypothetical protein